MAVREKIVTDILQHLHSAKTKAEILAINNESWRLPLRTFERYLATAQKHHKEAQNKAQEALANTIQGEVIKAAKNGLKSDLEIEAHLCKIAFGEIDVEETTKTPTGIIKFKRKPSPSEMTKAADILFKKRGTYAAEKHEVKTDMPVLQFNFPNAKD